MSTQVASPRRATPAAPRRGDDLESFLAALEGEPDLADLSPMALRVLAGAAACFYRHGAAATSVRTLAQVCGLSPGALYNHYASKQELLHRLVAHGHARMERRLDASGCDDPSLPPAERLSRFVRAHVAGHLRHGPLAQVVRRDYVHLQGAAYAGIVARRRAIRGRLVAVLAAGAADGSMDLLGDPTGQALMVLDLCSRTADWYDPGHAGDPDELVERYVAGVARLVGVRQG